MGSGALAEPTLVGLHEALADEWEAEARYEAFAGQLGAPFPRLERAEHSHADVLSKLLAAHHQQVPTHPTTPRPPTEASVAAACSTSLEGERANVALYDRLLASDAPEDVRCVYAHLRSRSLDRHIPALQRCASGGP